MVTGKTIYPRMPKLHGQFFYLCAPCDAYVGTHRSNQEPLGTLANKELRQLRMRCHDLFDRLWRSGQMSRHDAYDWLRDKMNLSKDDAHIGKFNKELCLKLISLINIED